MDKGGTAPWGVRLPSGGGAVGGIGSDFHTNLNTGVGTFAIPIELPAGFRGQAPQLALQYSSGAGADAFGLGWSLGSLEIRRDARNGVPSYTAADALLLAGQELVAVGGGVLRPRVDPSMQRVRRSGAGWELTDRQGTRFLLGVTEQGQERHPDRAGEDAVFAWLVERVEDTSGNVTTYGYLRDGGRLYLHRIGYAVNRLEIEYESRPDPRTVRRGGFTQRTALRARRLAVHRPALSPSLLRAYDLGYEQDPVAGHSLLVSVTLTGFLPDGAGGTRTEQAPALRLGYSAFEPARRRIRPVVSPEQAGPPGLADAAVDLVDLEGFGLPGVLEATATSHRYWPNRGDGRWSPPVRLRHFPQAASLADPRVRLADVDGDGRVDLVVGDRRVGGWYPGEPGRTWGGKRPGRTGPAVEVRDDRTRWVDATGDGLVDLLRSTGRGLVLVEGDGTGWAGHPRVVPRRRDDPAYPDVALDDPRVRFADLCGDGLLDVVRLWARQLEVWPALGTLRWAPRTVLPLPGAGPARFDPRRCHLADVNGDGLADVVYVDTDAIYVWVNRGESMAPAIRLAYPPPPAVAAVRTADMLGTTTTGLLFCTSRRPGVRDAYRFLDLTGGVKPYLLTRIDNGVGKLTTIRYGSSSAHRLRDRAAGADWPTFLPRAVQVVDAIEHTDQVTGRRAGTEFRYHAGHYEPRTQRFAGFATVETVERYGEGTAPVLTRSRFHLGLPGEVAGVPPERAAALRGQLYRRETLSPDGSPQADRPYLVESSEWDVRVVATGTAGVPVLLPLPRMRRVERWERGQDPAVTVTELAHDEFGNVTRERRTGHAPGQPELELTITASYLNEVDRWLLGLPARRTVSAGGVRLEDARYAYDGLPPGQVGAGLLSRRERLAFTQAQLDQVFGPPSDPPSSDPPPADPPSGPPRPAELAALGYRAEPGPDGVEWWFDEFHAEHDSRGNVVTSVDPTGGRTTVAYDADGLQPVRATNPLGHAYLADYHPRLDTIVRYQEPNGTATRFAYSPLGRVVAEQHPGDPADDPTVRFEYRAGSLPVATVMRRRRADGPPRRSITYYDGLGREAQTRARQDDGSFFVAPRSVTDLRGLVVESRPAFRSASESFDLTEHPGLDRRYRTSFDALRRATEVVDPAGRRAFARIDGTRVSFFDTQDTDPGSPFADTPRVQTVDAWGRLVEVAEETGTHRLVTRYGYDPRGHLSTVTDPAGPLLTQTHDAAGRLLQVVHRDAGTRRFLRDARGAVVRYLDGAGRQVSWTYDQLGRTSTVALAGTVTERYHYDAGEGTHLVGRLSHVDDELGRQSFGYDPSGRIVATTRSVAGQVFRYEFDLDADGRRTRVRHPDGAETAYRYDALGRLASVSGLIDRVEYDQEGRRSAVHYTGGVVATFGYDPALGRLREHAVTVAGQDLFRQRLDYDAAGNVVRVDDLRDGGTVPAPVECEYDALNRLVRARGGPPDAGYDHRFAYDGIGNLVRNDTWRPEPIGYQGARLVTAGTDTYGYDGNGCLTARPGMTLEYDARELLRRVVRDDGVVVELGYDHAARRLRKRVTDGTGSRDTLYIGESYEVRPDGTTLRYLADPDGDGATLVFRDGVPARLLLADRLGTVVAVRAARSGVTHQVHYSGFGVRLGPPADIDELGEVLFAGRRFDPETGLYHARMRYYDPLLGRFLTPDPVAVVDPAAALIRPLALNPYVYVLDNPLRFTDPTGLWTFWEGVLTVVLVAAVVVAAGLTLGTGAIIALGVGAAVGALIGGVSTNSVDGALAGAMLGFGIVATVLTGVYLGGLIGGVWAVGSHGLGLGALVGGTAGAVQAMGFIPMVRQDRGYQDVLGYASWLNPWAWPGHAAGAVVFVINAVAYGIGYAVTLGDPPDWLDMEVSFEQGMVVTTGGLISPRGSTVAFNLGAFTTANRNHPDIQHPATREFVLRHERGHMLNNASFGILQVGRVLALDIQDNSFWEQLAESNTNPYDPTLTGPDYHARWSAGGRAFGSIPWWTP